MADLEDDDMLESKVDEYSQSASSDSELSEEDRELLAENIKIGSKRTRPVERDSDDELEHMFDDEEIPVLPKEEAHLDVAEYDEYDEDDMKDFIEDSESGEEGPQVERDLTRHAKPVTRSPWLDRGLSRETLHDLTDIFGDGSEYVDLVLAGMRQMSLKGTDAIVEGKPETEQKVEEQEMQIDESALPWLTSRLCSLYPDRFSASEALQETVKAVFCMLRSGLAVPFIAFYRKEYISNMSINDIWTLSDEMRRWSQISRRRKLLLHAHLGLVNQLRSLNLDPLDHFINSCDDEDVLEVCNEFLSELKRSSRGKGRFVHALNARLDVSFCPSPTQFFDHVRKDLPIDTLQLSKAPPEMDEALSTYLTALFAMHPISYMAIRDALSPCITVTPTAKGDKVIDNRHALAPIKYLTRKPIDKFQRDEFVVLSKAQNDGLLIISTEFLNRSRAMDRLLDAVPRSCERILRRVIEDFVSPRISKQVLAKLGRRAEDWLAQHLQFALQDRLTSPPMHQRIVAFTVDPVESIVAAVYLDESGTVRDTLHQNYSQSSTDHLITFIQEADPEVVLVSGRHCAVYDDYYELHKRNLGYSIIFSEDDTARSCHDTARMRARFPEHSSLVRYCMGVASRARDPLLEFARLTDDELLGVDLHPQQSSVNQGTRLRFLSRAITNVVSVVGLDLSDKENWPAIRHILEPGAAARLLSTLPNVSSRSDMQRLLGSTQFSNIAPFLSIPSPDEPLDRTRVHPEDYTYARKMAADALDMDEYTEEDEDAGREAVKRILRKPTPALEQLDLSDYARKLSSHSGVSKAQTLLDIRSELIAPFKDLRAALPAIQMAPSAVLQMLSGVKLDTLARGQLVKAKIVRGRPYDALLEPSQLQALFIENTRYPHSTPVFEAAISAVIPENMLVHLSMEPVDLAEPRSPIYGPFDIYYDQQRAFRHAEEIRQQQSTKEPAPAMAFTQHPLYRVCTKGEAERSLSDAPVGHAVVRPSRTYGPDHFALTWKVDDQVFQHVDLKKIGNKFSIDNVLYNSIDEIMGRYIEPIVGFLAEVRACSKFLADGRVEAVEAHLMSLRQSDPNRIAYCLSLSPTLPGTVTLSYIKSHAVHESVLVMPSGFRFRRQQFERLELFINWFKTHFNNKAPQTSSPAPLPTRETPRNPLPPHTRPSQGDRGHQARLPDYSNRRPY